MKKMKKLVALLLAVVMVLGLLPGMTVHTHANEYHTHGVEEYPVIALDTATLADISEAGNYAYFTFTPEATDLYYFYSSTDFGYCDPYGTVYDAEMNVLTSVDDGYNDAYGVSSPNFFISQVMEAGVTYVLEARLYSTGATGTYNVTLTRGHSYESAVTKENTCTEDGVLTWTCTYCGDSYDEPIPAAHTWEEETGICSDCGETYLITGVCGDSLTWELDWFGNMTISGTGDMYDYFYSWEEFECIYSEWYKNYNTDIKKVVIEEGCTSIGAYAFYQANNMAEVSIPASVTEIGAHAFDNTGLTAIEVPETVTTLGEGAFASNFTLAYAKLPSGLLTIPASCFEYCGELSEVIWPDAATSVGDKAFYNCGLGDLVVPEGIAYIGASAFGGNSDMTKLILPTTLAQLADRAFSSCWNVLDFVFTGSAPIIPDAAFNWVTANVWYPKDNAAWTAEVMKDYNGTLTWKPMCSTHAYGEVVTVPATCETGEYKTRTCSDCGWVDNSPAGEPLGHDYVYTVIEPNCGTYEYGRTEITCTRCDYYSSENWVYPEHQYEETVIPPTCTTDGFTTYTCTVCGASYTDNYIYSTGHVVDNWSEPTEATCTEASVKTGTCSVCNETATEEVSPALGHNWDEENPVENEDGSKTYSCTRCDATYRTEGTRLYLGDNDFSLAARTPSASKTFTADNDGTLTITVSDLVFLNTWNNAWTPVAIDWVFNSQMLSVAINDTTADYTVEGSEAAAKIIMTTEVKSGDVVTITLNHSESESAYYDKAIKVNMNLALESTHTHSYTTEVVEPTCTEDGSITYTCTDCGYSYTESTPALGHSFSYHLCDVCNALDPEFYAANEHVTRGKLVYMLWVLAGRPVPSTDESPFTDVSEDDYYFDAIIWAIEEGITNGMTANTYNPDGTCNRAQVITYLHRYMGRPEPWTTESPFTDVPDDTFYSAPVMWAVEQGLQITNVCSDLFHPMAVCTFGQILGEDVIHFTEVIPAVEATCTETGLTMGESCADCGMIVTVQEEVPALGHTEEIIPAVEATCTETGLTEGVKCAVCGEVLTAQEEVPALGHTEEVVPGYEATFDAPGMTEGKRCSVCGEVLAAQETIAMLDYNEGIVPLDTLVVSCGDYETDGGASEGPANLAIDDDLNTIWHTDWQGTSRDNHWIQFELTEGYEVNGLRYKPRVTGNTNGIITGYDIQVSDDGETFTSVASGSWEGDRNWKVVEFEAQNVKYVRLVATDALTDNTWVFACAAEIRLTGVKAAVHEHSFGEWTVVTEATCTTAGEEIRTCECGETETREIAALGHTEEIIPAVAATCIESGLTEGKECSVCGEITVAQEVVPALGHDFVNGDCSRCDAVKDATFTDVPVGSFFFDPVEWAVEQGITTGANETTFDPTGKLLRAQVVVMLWRAAGKPEPASTKNPFVDVTEKDFYFKAVLWAVEEGITNGSDATHFNPFGVTNRAQAVTFLWRYLGEPTSTAANNFEDVVSGMWYEAPINWAVENGVTNGMSETQFGITADCNRAQMVTFMYRALA